MEAREPLRAFGERDDSGDQRLHLNGAGCNEFDGAGVFACRGTGTLEADLAGNDFLQRERDFGRNVADEDDGAAFADGVDCDGDGLRTANGFDGNIHAVAGGQLENAGGEILAGGENFRCADLFCETEPGTINIRDEDARPARDAEGLRHEQADHSGADDERCAAGRNWGERNGVQSDSDRFEHGGMGKRKGVRQPVHDARGNSDVFGEGSGATVVRARNAENLAMVAKVDFSPAARGAVTTKDRGIEGDAVAVGKLRNAGTERRDHAGGLVAHDEGRNAASRRAIVTMHVTSADSAGGDANENFGGAGLRVGQLGDFQLAILR